MVIKREEDKKNNKRKNRDKLNHKMNQCSPTFLTLIVIGSICFITGIVLCSFWPHSCGVFDGIVYSKLPLRTKSWGSKFWNDNLNTTKNVDFYVFNWTNPEELATPGMKPNFVEVGPYSFIEKTEKVNITFHPENDTVSYDELKTWHFDKERSVGNLSDKITQLNVPIVSVTHHERYSHFNSNTLSLLLRRSRAKLYIKKSMDQLLFTGYKDRVIEFINKGSRLDAPLPDHFGWYYKQNGTLMNGHMNIETGENNLSNFGMMKAWNYINTTTYYKTPCNNVEGSSGEFWSPGRSTDDIKTWMATLCRSVTYEFTGETTHQEIPGYKYSIGDKTLENSGCYCNGECSPKGVINTTACHHGSPIFTSFPHFYKGDPTLRDHITGINPNEIDHSSYIVLNPSTGMPLDSAAKFQINVLLQPSITVSLFKNVPTIYFPIFWVNVKNGITEKSVGNLSELLSLPNTLLYACIALLVLGALLLIIGIIYYSRIQSEILWISKRTNRGAQTKGRHNVDRIRITEECNCNERLI